MKSEREKYYDKIKKKCHYREEDSSGEFGCQHPDVFGWCYFCKCPRSIEVLNTDKISKK